MIIGSLIIKYLYYLIIKQKKTPIVKSPLSLHRLNYCNQLKKTHSLFKLCVTNNSICYKVVASEKISTYTLNCIYLLDVLNSVSYYVKNNQYIPAYIKSDNSYFCEKNVEDFLSENNHILLFGSLVTDLDNHVDWVLSCLDKTVEEDLIDYYYSRLSVYLHDLHEVLKVLIKCYKR